jgi:hypothetical protein
MLAVGLSAPSDNAVDFRLLRCCGHEALLFFLAGEKESYVFALTREDFIWKFIPLGAQALSEKVAAFRHGLEVEALSRKVVVECAQVEAEKRGLSRTDCNQVLETECAQAHADGRSLLPIACDQATSVMPT